MHGSFQNSHSKRAAHSKLIEKWLLSRAAEQMAEDDELHINRIDADWKPRESWIIGGAEAFQLAVALRNHHAPNYSVALVFSLKAGQNSGQLGPSTISDLIKAADASPPSLYLLTNSTGAALLNVRAAAATRVGAEHLTDTDIDTAGFKDFGPIKRCHYLEFRQSGFTDLFRTLIIEA